jgi:hypothetical protein
MKLGFRNISGDDIYMEKQHFNQHYYFNRGRVKTCKVNILQSD